MEDAAKMELRHWANFDQNYLKGVFRDADTTTKVAVVLSERDTAIAERDAAIVARQSANVERDSALLQRDIAYADRHAAWVERDNALAALSMIQASETIPESAAQLMKVVNIAVDRFPQDSNLLGYPSSTNGMGRSVHLEGKLPQRRAKEGVKKAQKETNRKRKENGMVSVPDEKESGISSPPAKKSMKRRKQLDAPAKGEKIKRDDVSQSMVLYVAPVDMASTAIPFCSCTGTNRPCYRWGKGGWQSACCTNYISEYPLPMNQAKNGSRVAGRKMSIGAFKKLLERLCGEGVDITQPVDLKDHWAKHGTNRYIIVR